MSLKSKYIVFIGLLHGILILLIYRLFVDDKWIFIASEFLIICSLYLSFLLYRSLIRPITLMQSGTDAIAEADFSIKYLKTGSKEMDHLVEVFNTMIDQLREERTKMSQQNFFIQKLIEVTPLAILIIDYQGMISTVNPAAKEIFKLDDQAEGASIHSYDSELMNLIMELDMNCSKVISTNGIDKFKCQLNEVIHQGFKRKFILVDNLSSELLASEKNAYGRIIRMMAHEINNSMGAINSIMDSVIEFGFKDTDSDDELKQSLLIAKERNIGLSQFVENYASILRLPKPQVTTIDLNQLAKSSGQLCMPQAQDVAVKLHFDLCPDTLYIQGDKVQLEQVVFNILKNSLEAISTEGNIWIRTSNHPVKCVIEDDGSGIPASIADQIFKPFFSSKPTGQGIGLMLVREILQQHQFKFSLQSNVQSGRTKFEIEF